MTDAMLIQEYARSRSPRFLAELVGRHADWVYSAALRMVGDADLASDVAQAVFLVLVKKAALLNGKPVNAWLFGVTRFAAKHAIRDRARRHRHERMAAIMIGQSASNQSSTSQTQENWAAIAPMLDELVGRLNARHRRAILLRFYQAKSMAEVGEALGVSQDAAKKRVAKAVKRLREMLAGRGIHVPADALGLVLLGRATHSAPAKLAELGAKPRAGAMNIANGVIQMMLMMKFKIAALMVATVALVPAVVALAVAAGDSLATMPAGQANSSGAAVDATDLYARAANSLTVYSPADSNLVYPEFSPASAEWRTMEAAAWQADVKARELVRQARAAANMKLPGPANLTYYNKLRSLANHIGDSAVYADTQANDAEAIELIRDLKHMSDLLENSTKTAALDRLVGVGINAMNMDRLAIIASGVVLTNDPQNKADLQVRSAKEFVAQLIEQPNPADRLERTFVGQSTAQWTSPDRARVVLSVKRSYAEQVLAAMSLACHVYLFEKGHWPDSLSELVPAYLPTTTIDPWGDGKQVYGYVLVRGGLPDGSDRPMVFCRFNSKDGLFYITNQIHFGYYINDGSNGSARQWKRGGQFRDVTRWEPAPDSKGPTTRPIPPEALGTQNEPVPASDGVGKECGTAYPIWAARPNADSWRMPYFPVFRHRGNRNPRHHKCPGNQTLSLSPLLGALRLFGG